MNTRRCALLAASLLTAASFAQAQQRTNEVRRAQPVEEEPIPRALPVDEPSPRRAATPAPGAAQPVPVRPRVQTPLPVAPAPTATPTPRPAATAAPTVTPTPASVPPADTGAPPPATEESAETGSPASRQLDYANALFGRKLYDLAVPEYERFLGQYPGAAGRASAYFYLGQCYRSLNRPPAARSAFQSVLDEHPESEFAGPAAYGVGEILFNQREYAGAAALFQRSATKTKEPALALSARYFEARCLENLDRKDEAVNVYLQVIDAKGANPYREDARMAAGSILLARGRKADALRQLEALANETGKAPLKVEASVRAGLVAADLAQAERGKDKAMLEKATALLQRARTLPEAGRWRGIAEVGLLRLLYSTGQHGEAVAAYRKGQEQLPDDVRPEMMLLAANSERQLGRVKEAEAIYNDIISRYPAREEAKDARYQRLINIYNSNPSGLMAEVDSYLATNPGGERADQAKLLKAEAFYKQGNFTEAAPLYEQLRASQLAPKLRAEAAYKLAWCYVQSKNTQGVVDAFGYFLKAFADNPQAPAALTHRALALQELKDYSAAIADLNTLITNFPQAREREAALQQKALLMGQQENTAGMTQAFQQLLKEYPKTAAAAQAQYYIGKAAFEAKDYKTAVAALDASRKLNKEQYYTPATVRIISTYYYQKNRPALVKEVDGFLAADPQAQVPSEVLHWLGLEFYNEKNYASADKYLRVLGRNENSSVPPDFWFYLADAQTKLAKFAEAEASYEQYLRTSGDPAAKVKALLALGATKIAAQKPDDAQRIAEEIMSLQPEGRVNAEARLLAGDVQMERGRFDEAGRAFMGVALLYDDPTITPRALQKAASAYEKAGKRAEADRAAEELRLKYPGFAGG
jgi:TolA-binding protein